MRSPNVMKLVAVSVLVAAVALAKDKQPEVVVQEATGEAAILNGNEPQAKKEARESALRQAVEQVAGVLVEASTLTQNNQLISDRIFAKSAGYVRKYDVLSEEKAGNIYRVTVRAQVGAKDLDRDLEAVKALVQRLAGRKMLILLQEQTFDEKGAIFNSGVMASVLTEAFKRDGWTMIDPAFAAGQLSVEAGVAMATPEVKRIGELTKVDYILYGKASFRREPDPGPMLRGENGKSVFFVTGQYDLTLFATDSGTQLGSVAGKLNWKRGEDVLGKTMTSYERTAFELVTARASDIVGGIRSKAMEALRDSEQNGNRVAVTVTGLPDFRAVQAFKRALTGAAPGVRDMSGEKFGEGRLVMDVTYLGSTEDFAERVSGTAVAGRKMSVTGLSGNTMQISVVK